MNRSAPATKMQFDSMPQQSEANALGMWVFLATEVLFFGAPLLIYSVYRWFNHDAFVAASHQLNLPVAVFNTVLLLTSSLSIALAEWYSEQRRRARLVQLLLAVTIVLGIVFLALKGYEYREEYHKGLMPFIDKPFAWDQPEPEAAMLFFNLYFVLTGLHALHLFIGCCLVAVVLIAHCRRRGAGFHQSIKISALYWHFVDIVWVFLLPLFYLIR